MRTPTTSDRYFDICSEQAAKKDWAEFVPAMRNKVMRFEIVDEEEWGKRLNGMFCCWVTDRRTQSNTGILQLRHACHIN